MTIPELPRQVLSVQQVAQRFGVDPKTVWRWEASGALVPDFRTPGGHRRYYADKIDEMLRGQP